ncbi:MAG: hypothetical protein SFZ02_11320 [bacterium]|nr:hypothetical protein [bacterium]
MARISMTSLIAHLRELTSASTDEFTLNDIPYFSDDHLQTVLDSTSTHQSRVAIYPVGDYIGGAMVYTRYPLPHYMAYTEGAGDGSAWRVVDGTGATAPAHTLNMSARHILFDAPTDGRTYYLTATSYDMHRAASAIWLQKAAHSAKRVNFSVDGQQVSAGDYHAHCLKMVAYYDGLAGATTVRRVRMDEV